MYPGEVCNDRSDIYECSTGKRMCKSHVCEGVLQGAKCLTSFDCQNNNYCDTSTKQCAPVTNDGKSCYTSDECKKSSRCMFQTSASSNGICQPYFSLTKGSSLFAWNEEDLFLCSDGYGLLKGYNGELNVFDFKQGTYVCGEPLKSLRAGSNCDNFKECPSSIDGLYAMCGCSYSSTNQICSILYSNQEYKEYVSSIKEFVQSTKHCHNARSANDGQCDQKERFHDYMCKMMKAKHYLANHDVS